MDTHSVEEYTLAFHLPVRMAELFKLLVEHSKVTSKEIVDAGFANHAPNAIQKLRPRLDEYKVEIQSQRGVGYWLDPPDKLRVSERMARYYAANGRQLGLPGLDNNGG